LKQQHHAHGNGAPVQHVGCLQLYPHSMRLLHCQNELHLFSLLQAPTKPEPVKAATNAVQGSPFVDDPEDEEEKVGPCCSLMTPAQLVGC
jgi:hypothetical protein